ncbi:hypothetical protein [Sphingobium sp.]|uniref:hypothetical protein n=1 Tax=Sphingobium sp. TaxID=1912891 RepID=UPI000DB17DBD|nr:hypothetical protein [Sphingobium sp.]PZU62641.1 MAG: hypothetical protein DI540_26240 [Sphingobium sp.]
MTYPFDQISALGKANGQFATTLAQVARESGETYVKVSGKAASTIFDQFKEFKPGTSVPAFKSDELTGLIGEIEKRHVEASARIRSAFEDWQGAVKDAFSQATEGQQALTEKLTVWFQPVAKTPAAPDKAAEEPASTLRASAKSRDTA